ncbi:MAG: metal-dependent hydrolase [Chlorobi bacterium]|nr:metal-dependent hydrolase [Chlorobiota bacterium]
MKITYLGHASLLIETGNSRIVVDPFITGNPLAQGKIDVDAIPADYILITHAHQDHILDVERIADNNPGAVIVSNFEIASYYGSKGYKYHPMNHGGSWMFDFGRLTYVNAVHTSSFPDGRYGGQPGGFVLETPEGNIYIAGDTALTVDMEVIPEMTELDLAVLPIGDNFTMGYESAIIAADYLEVDLVMGYHFDTFDLIKIDHEKVKAAFERAGLDFILPEIGAVYTFKLWEEDED